MIELWVSRHNVYGSIEIAVGIFYLSESQVGVSTVEKCLRIVEIQTQCFVVFCQRVLVFLTVIECQCLVVVVSGLRRVKFNRPFELLQRSLEILVLEVAQPEIILCGCILTDLTSSLQILNGLLIVLDLAVTIASMEKGFEVCFHLVTFDVLDSTREIIYCELEVHKPCVDHATVEVVKTVVRLKFYRSFELCQCIVDLI